ncbi:helix-turn-helix transcriptional regulator [Stenotrophomonas maltophilia]|uniref:XRE family transcriptional regulator n=1 Tax=Stenotrophomonas maltophilia group TaxID=995085 RepID=UPI0016516979|nr:helix-turn-helix transcriptional regulator [Stenotrophomonas maltophilia]MDZ5815021.1 helix-turn-helix transcriptional regulator [Stenotrophomonas maltophilia]
MGKELTGFCRLNQQHSVTDFCEHSGMETIGDRVKKARADARMSRSELAVATGIGYSTIAELERGGMQTSTKLRVIASALGVSLTWLETGKGTQHGLAEPQAEYVAASEIPAGYVRFRMMDAQAAGGVGVVNQDYPAVLREVDIAEWQVRSQIGFIPDEGRVQLITVRGDSMHPDVKNGDVVMVDTARGFFDGDGVYLINLNGYTMVKRLQMLPNGLHIVSTNPKYQNAVLPPDEIDTLHVAGRIVGAALMRRGEDI